MTVTTTTWDALRDKKSQLIRKALEGSVFIAPVATTAITALTDGATPALIALPAGYEDLGWTDDNGVAYSRATEQSTITSHGSAEPTRIDITKDTTTLKVFAQETKILTIGLEMGLDVSGVTADATTGEVAIAAPFTPVPVFYRLLHIALDEGDGGEIYIARFLPRAQVTAVGDQKYAKDDIGVGYDLTFTGFLDSTLGFSAKRFWGGPGWKALLDDMGLGA